MWTILIVEDEDIVRESIRQTVDWESYGYRVIGEAADGHQAMTFIREHRPDVVIADIVMPVMDGITLLKQARSEGYECRFLMLTCMGEFEYAREAVEHGASNYLLKLSLSDEQLRRALDKITAELEKSRAFAASRMSAWLDEIWRRAENRSAPSPAEELPPFYMGRQVQLQGILHGGTAYPSLPERSDMQEGDLSQELKRAGITVRVHWFAEQGEAGEWRCMDMVPAVVLSPRGSPGSLSAMWRELLERLDRVWYGMDADGTPRGRRLAAGQEAYELDGDGIYLWSEEEAYLQALQLQRLEQARELLEQLRDTMRELQLPASTVLLSARYLKKRMERLWKPASAEEGSLCGMTHEELFRELLRQVEEWAGARLAERELVTDHPVVNAAVRYVLEHYGDNLTVKDMARIMAVHEDYLSNLFKKKTGMTLIHFLHRVRIERACELLVNTAEPVSEITGRVGFTDEAYFIKIFKRMMNETPGAYRKRCTPATST
ncbi:response regulator transcription factor [Gorillibacterium sp. sgz5001074]|uniref:response regulator transcription factor n=1 Tax=Gorillibacterium sp. sgz5001074 TaxID=3446695 RepID=UPI003F679503